MEAFALAFLSGWLRLRRLPFELESRHDGARVGGGYAKAWRDRDADAAAALFTEDSLYRDHPTRAASRRGGVRSYWANVTSTQDHVNVRMGRPIESPDRRRAAVEFWVGC